MKHSPLPSVIKSFAKLNLYLQVLNKRKDNFHNLSTLFVRIGLSDTIILKKRQDSLIRIKCDSRQVPKDKTNLCFRAAELLKQELKLGYGLEIEIKKRIPVGAGLGGGSSNAASVLLGLNKYWQLNLSKVKLISLASKLGCDVPFFIHDTRFALGSQRGDKIKPLTFLEKIKPWFILVYPSVKVSTPLIYQKFDLYLSGKQAGRYSNRSISELTRQQCNVKILLSELLKNGSCIDPGCLFNDLEVITSSLYPAVNRVKDALFALGLDKVMMSGSGPAVFGICNCRTQAQKLSNQLRRKHKSWKVFSSSAV